MPKFWKMVNELDAIVVESKIHSAVELPLPAPRYRLIRGVARCQDINQRETRGRVRR